MTWAECESTLREIGLRVRAYRLRMGLTQDGLAVRSKVLGRTSIANIEAGRQKMTVLTLCALARALGIQPGDLLNGALSESKPVTVTVAGKKMKISPESLAAILESAEVAEVPE